MVEAAASIQIMKLDAPIFVAGHNGLVGSAIVRCLRRHGYANLLLRDRRDLDLSDQEAVDVFFAAEHPAYVFIAAAKVGGIQANDRYPADFLLDNLLIECNLVRAAHRNGLDRLLFLGSSCIYPRDCPQPILEEYLLTGPLEATNESYAVAKIAGVKLCEAMSRQHGHRYSALMPTNLYGPNDNFDLANSHVLPALLRKAHEAKQRGDSGLDVWGSGRPRREFLHVDDLAEACVMVMERDLHVPLANVGTGSDVSIAELAELVMDVVGLKGQLRFDSSKPDGTPRKLLNVSRLRALGWQPRISLREGLESVYRTEFDLAFESKGEVA